MEYKSCEWIESRLVLEQKQLKFCCIGHSGSKGYVPICDYDGGEIPVAEIEAARARLIQQNNSPGDSPCKGCHFLQEKDWQAERRTKALLEQVYVSSFSICNLHCRYCFVYLDEYTEVSHVAGYPLLPVFQQLVEKGILAEDGYIEWGGGEPTIVKGFAEIMRMLMETGHSQQIHTSSVKFSPELAEALRRGRVRAVTSVDAGTRETYKEVKGRDRFDIVWENVGKYAGTGGDMTVKYILRHNNSDAANVRGFMEHMRAAGVKKLVLTPDFREIAQEQVREETIYAFALMVDAAERNGIQVQIREEYLNPEQMRMVKKYVPLRLKGWKYHAHAALARAQASGARLARKVRALPNAGKARKALEQAESMLEDLLAKEESIVHPLQILAEPREREDAILGLLESYTLTPHPRLGKKITELVTARSSAPRTEPLVLGVSEDAWTTDGKPGYVVVDASTSPLPVARDMWFTCWADPADLPVRLTISDGINEDFEYTFLYPHRLRVPMPAVPPGESRVYAVKTDKTWSRLDKNDARKLGVNIATSI